MSQATDHRNRVGTLWESARFIGLIGRLGVSYRGPGSGFGDAETGLRATFNRVW